MYATTQSQAEANVIVMTSQLICHFCPLYGLVDVKATYCFVARGIVERLWLKL